MPRATNNPASRDRRRKVLKQAEGYRGSHHRLFKTAKQAVDHAGKYAYRDRKAKKREIRALWIARINAAARNYGLSYNRLVFGLHKAGMDVNRKMIADLAVKDEEAFAKLIEIAKSAIAGEIVRTDEQQIFEVIQNPTESTESSENASS
ncbi:MAG TPA: 50S ribosomal protein L20 [Candidatus Hydrogenedens sp.]|nr:50S ribosomal protein L20 [Candidatus Hydrogenedens sp.]HOK09933.1 50S ribosomal protein L20 [Candidatus Hydrogenedens sp.]HOL19655.1 50S ribosomal protein L20 [Candidatus Hydrogenedens sp.]HPP57721.1 50S ribosomal protein L20 [Candidatus Hydrogenedens sp.]